MSKPVCERSIAFQSTLYAVTFKLNAPLFGCMGGSLGTGDDMSGRDDGMMLFLYDNESPGSSYSNLATTYVPSSDARVVLTVHHSSSYSSES